jgi:hypothetical protein
MKTTKTARRGAGPNYKELHMDTKRKIEIGKVYSVKVGGSWLPVRVEKSLGHGRYEGASLPSGTKVKFSTDAVRGDGRTEADWKAQTTPRPGPALGAEEIAKPLGPPSGAKASEKERAGKTKKAPKERKPSGLDAAIRVLREEGKPMNIADVVKVALEKGYWKTGGKTPAATVYAAIIREIAAKGADSRFRRAEVKTSKDGQTKAQRGYFELTNAGKEVA